MTEDCSVCTFSLEPPSIRRFVLTYNLGLTLILLLYCDNDQYNAVVYSSLAFQTKSCVCDRHKWKHEMEATRGCKESIVRVFG